MKELAKSRRTASSVKFSLELAPTSRSRKLVLLSGGLFLVAGLGITVQLPIDQTLKINLAAIWLADTLRELARQWRGQARVRCLMLDASGRVAGRSISGKDKELQILKGSVVLHRWAWLRLGFDDGLHYVEWLFKADYAPESWRRLQLLWRHAL